jgi:DNA ligase-associated metallophosphoesterase
MNGDITIPLQGETFTLLPERAAYWHQQKALLVADPHWGKAATFRAGGIPVPAGTTLEAIERLNSAVNRTHSERVIFLGDLLHAKAGRSDRMFESLAQWRASHPGVDVTLVRGNHDRNAGDPPVETGITCVDAPFIAPPFVLAHHPSARPEAYVIAGHVHPGIRLYGRARQRERLPCFVISSRFAILPAFGDFTGLGDIEPAEDDRIFAVGDGHVIEVNI